jgi:EAL domain-containing protein (putative c-di-GMP-specific phosphodiesterase class I)
VQATERERGHGASRDVLPRYTPTCIDHDRAPARKEGTGSTGEQAHDPGFIVLPKQNANSVAETDTGATTPAESLGWQLRAALPPLRLHSLSICDHEGEILWLSEGALGPDEHGFVVEALAGLRAEPSRLHREVDFGDGRGAVFVAIRAPQNALVGLAMVLVDSKAFSAGPLGPRVVTPPFKAILQRVAILLRPPTAAAPRAEATGPGPAVAPRAETTGPRPAVTPRAETTGPRPAVAPRAETTGPRPAVAPRTETTGPRPAVAVPVARPAPVAPAASTKPPPAPAVVRTPAPAKRPAPARGSGAERRAAPPARNAAAARTPQPVSEPAADTPAMPVREMTTLEWSAPEVTNDAGQPASSTHELAPNQIDEILTIDLTPDPPSDVSTPVPVLTAAPPVLAAPVAAPARAAKASPKVAAKESRQAPRGLELQLHELAKLRPGGRTRRFQLTAQRLQNAATSEPSHEIEPALQELLSWLTAHADLADQDPLSFQLRLTAPALADEDLPRRIAELLRAAGAAPSSIGFEIGEATCIKHRPHVERFVAACEKMGCFWVLDDFTFDSAVLDLLRSNALRLVKVEAQLTTAALRDKLAQARVIAISQATKVLGTHCAAQQVDGQPLRRWLTAAAFDFAQGRLFDGPQSLESFKATLAQPK